MRKQKKKRLVGVIAHPIMIPHKPNQIWSIDFMTDTLISSSRFRTLNIIDDFNREALAIEAASSITGLRLTRILDKVASYRGYPKQIRCGNGAELRSKALAQWAPSGQHTVCTTRKANTKRYNRTL